jgi:NADPH-dependent 2,4-dienoyl-CoA reductase/sulfur reductase-like enzyme
MIPTGPALASRFAVSLPTLREPSRETPVLKRTEVLVVGGGTAGVSAAVAAARSGAEVTLVERYGSLGGLATGGLIVAPSGATTTRSGSAVTSAGAWSGAAPVHITGCATRWPTTPR